MDIDEIPPDFNLLEYRLARVRQFGQNRLSLITSNDPSIPKVLAAGARVILHLLPISTGDPSAVVNIKMLQGRDWPVTERFTGMGRREARFNFDGFLIKDYSDGVEELLQRVHMFRNGAVEVVRFYGDRLEIKDDFEIRTIKRIEEYVGIQRELKAQLPIIVMLTLWGVKDYPLKLPRGANEVPLNRIDRDLLTLPERRIDVWETPIAEILRPAFDALYQDTGLAGSPNYDENEKWKGGEI